MHSDGSGSGSSLQLYKHPFFPHNSSPATLHGILPTQYRNMCQLSSLPLQLTQATYFIPQLRVTPHALFQTGAVRDNIYIYLVIKVCCFCLKDISESKFSKKWCSKKDRALVLKHILYISIQLKPRIQSIFCIVIVYRYGKWRLPKQNLAYTSLSLRGGGQHF